MAIDVTCPGCFKRFQVSDRYAGQTGPCPSCNTMIAIPKEKVKIHAPDDFPSGGKTIKGRAILKPIDRKVAVIGGAEWGIALLCVVGAIGLALLVNYFYASKNIGRWSVDVIASFGAVAVAFGTSIFGYILLRSGDELEYHEGEELYKRAGLCAAAYSLLWILWESIMAYMNVPQGSILWWIYLIPFIALSIVAGYGLFDLDYTMAVAHYLIYFAAIVVLRWAIGFGWIWWAANMIQQTTNGGHAPPPTPSVSPW